MVKRKILVIDDEVDFGFLMRRFFVAKNFEVFIALNLADGMRMLKEEKPDILFLDNNLPDGMGWKETAYIIMNYPLMQLNLISALHVPEKSTATFRILEKPLSWDVMNEVCDTRLAG